MNYLKILSSLGMHIGSSVLDSARDPYVYQYLLGIRNNYYILNITFSLFFLKKTLLYIEKLASINPYNLICFYHSDNSESDLVSSVIINLARQSNQSTIAYKWINGSFTNWNHIIYKMVEPLFTNRKERMTYGFQVILAKMIFILTRRSMRMDELNFSNNYGLMSRFWKFILLFQFFTHFKKLPSLFFYINKSFNNYPILECNKVNIPVISVVDSNSNLTGITYPIPGNDDSLILMSFILNLVNQSIIKGKYKFLLLNKLNTFDLP